MSKMIKQFVLSEENEKAMSFEGRIYQLGISGTPGQIIKINRTGQIILNSTGVFQINVTDDIPLNSVEVTEYMGITPLIIDIVYEGGGE